MEEGVETGFSLGAASGVPALAGQTGLMSALHATRKSYGDVADLDGLGPACGEFGYFECWRGGLQAGETQSNLHPTGMEEVGQTGTIWRPKLSPCSFM